jgi:hypothetical protein
MSQDSYGRIVRHRILKREKKTRKKKPETLYVTIEDNTRYTCLSKSLFSGDKINKRKFHDCRPKRLLAIRRTYLNAFKSFHTLWDMPGSHAPSYYLGVCLPHTTLPSSYVDTLTSPAETLYLSLQSLQPLTRYIILLIASILPHIHTSNFAFPNQRYRAWGDVCLSWKRPPKLGRLVHMSVFPALPPPCFYCRLQKALLNYLCFLEFWNAAIKIVQKNLYDWHSWKNTLHTLFSWSSQTRTNKRSKVRMFSLLAACSSHQTLNGSSSKHAIQLWESMPLRIMCSPAETHTHITKSLKTNQTGVMRVTSSFLP